MDDKSKIIFENILKRKSVRNYIKGKNISEPQIETILKAGMSAPSARNIQPWEFIVIKDRNILNNLAERQPYGKMLTNASLAIVVAGNMEKAGEHQDFWQQDLAAATENILLMTEALGLGAVWIGVYPKEERVQITREELNMPPTLIPFNIISIGYPEKEEQPKDKWNKENVHYDSF